MTTPKRAEWETLFKDFPAQKQYKIFEESSNICYNRSYCDDLNIPDPTKKRELINLCKKIACRYTNLPYIVRSEKKYSDRCSYFIHWAQDVIRKHFKVDLASNYYYHFIFKLIDVAREISWEDLKSPPCQRLFDSDFKHWEVEKDIHDYFKNVDTLSKKIDTDVDKRNSYLEYLTYIKGLYENNYSECCDPYDISYSNCPNYFVCNPKFHPNELIAKIKPDTQVRRVTVSEQRGQTGSRGSTLQGKSARYNTRNQGAYCPTGTTYDYRMNTCKTPEGLSFKVVDYGTHYDLPTLDNQFGSGDNTGMVVPGSNSEGSNTYSTFRLGFSAFLGLVIGVVFYLFIKRTTPIGQVLGGKKRKGKKTAEEAMVEIHEEDQLGGNHVNADALWDGYAADAQWGGYNADAQWDDHHADAQWDDHHGEGQWDDHHADAQWDDHHADAQWDDHHADAQWDDHHADAQWDDHHVGGHWDDHHGEGHWDDHHGEGHWDDHHGEGHWDDDHRGGGSSDYSNSYDNDRQLRFSYQPSYEPYD
ncbi:PIR protein [Plasmodium vivax]|uniref:VIR protein n=1 Tax=Plasmodium vivax TaxID=5855 RepID=A0A564ZQ06_PLAVI|nr:PIR protein [Plasmodium vivax]